MAPPLTQEWLDLEQQFGGRSTLHGTPAEITEQYNGLIAALVPLMPPPSENVEAKDGSVDGINYRVYTPKGSNGNLPVGVYTHGGGFVAGDLNGEDALCRALSEHVPCTIVSVDYRMGPQYKWPVMLEDSLKVWDWAAKNASSFGGNSNKLFSVGGSAGGGLALAIANHFAKKNDKSVKGTVAIVPVSLHWDHVPDEYKSIYTAYKDNEGPDVPVIDKASMESFYNAVDANPKDESLFTALSSAHKNFPPTYFATCGADPLRDDGTVMEQALKKAGVQTKLDHYEKLPHYFWIFPGFPPAQKFMGNLIAGTQWVVSQM